MESLAQDLAQMQRTPLAEAHVARLRRIGAERCYVAGEVVVRAGDAFEEFVHVEDGEIEIVDVDTGERKFAATLGPTQFMGEIGFLSGGIWSMQMRAARDTRVIAVPRRQMLDLMAQIPEMSDIVITGFAARRRRTLEAGDSGLTLVGSDTDRGVRRIASFLRRNRIPVAQLELGSQSADGALARRGLPNDTPAILFGKDQVVEENSPRAVARALGLDLTFRVGETYDVVIVGGGPSGIAAAGQDDDSYCVTLDAGDEVCAKSVIIATGVQYRRLGLERLEHFEGAGVYYAATDLEARWCRGADVVVVGGGNSAGQAAMFLSRTARHVHVLIRGSTLAASMSSYLSGRLERDPAITLHRRTEVISLHGDDAVEAVTIRDRESGQDWHLRTGAVFVMVGAAPNTDWLCGIVDLDTGGYVKTGEDVGATSPFATSAPGVFAVGDVRAGSVKRVASSVGEGSVVVSTVWEWING